MRMTFPRQLVLGVLVCGLLGGCTTVGTIEGDDCVSHHEPVAAAATWEDLEQEMLRGTQWARPVAEVRTQPRGPGVGAGEEVVRIVDLLDRRGRRLVQVDVWRTESGGWGAGVWRKCIE
ncbi:hypothetical protein [Nocardioides sp.]|uniref:hypothetical protein n=1 Tax=Nocardioides sp. TaxID=35761 RepID=UPI002D80A345|nr:hypothetical protein [Nocardioides sp.]